jgi:hypothetical protein
MQRSVTQILKAQVRAVDLEGWFDGSLQYHRIAAEKPSGGQAGTRYLFWPEGLWCWTEMRRDRDLIDIVARRVGSRLCLDRYVELTEDRNADDIDPNYTGLYVDQEDVISARTSHSEWSTEHNPMNVGDRPLKFCPCRGER